MDTLLQNLRYGLRGLWKDRAFTFVAVLTLALGIGANASIYSFLDALVLNPFGFPDMDRLAFVTEDAPDSDRISLSGASYEDLRTRVPQFESVAGYDNWDVNLTGGGEPEQILAYKVAHEFFPALSVRPVLGRTFAPDEDTPGHEHVTVLSHGLWQRRFGGDAGVVGRTVTLDGQPYTVVGVMPRDFRFPNAAQLYVPFVLTAEEKANRGNHYLDAVVKLKPGATVAQAQAALGPVLDGHHPEDPNHRFHVRPLSEFGDKLTRRLMWVLMAAVGLVLLAACANVASMLLARAAKRERELAIRSALGASRGRLVAQLLTESLLLAVLGGGFGLLLALWGVDLMRAGVPSDIERSVAGWSRAGLSGRMLLFTLVTVTLTTVLVGLVPALRASRADPGSTLRLEGRGTSGSKERHRLRQGLVAVQMAFALVLTVGACLNVRSFLSLLHTHPGFEREGVLTFKVLADAAHFPENADITRFQDAMVERLRALPGVTEAASVNYLPMGGPQTATVLVFEDKPQQREGERIIAHSQVVTPGYFRALRIPLREGEAFTGHERADGPRQLLISASLARRAYGTQSPLGKRIATGFAKDGQPAWGTVVGVVGDVQQQEPTDPFAYSESIYLVHTQRQQRRMVFTVRTSGDPMLLAPAVRRELAALAPDVPATDVRTLDAVVHDALSAPRYAVVLLVVFATIALVLSAVGLYGVMAYAVSQRTREIGIRMALGARGLDVTRLVVAQALWPAVAGVGVGLVGSGLLARVMASFLYGVSPFDALAFGGMPLVLLGVAALAALGPVRAAIRVDPAVAFRSE